MIEAVCGPRKSLPSPLMVAGELDGELSQRYPDERVNERHMLRVRQLRP